MNNHQLRSRFWVDKLSLLTSAFSLPRKVAHFIRGCQRLLDQARLNNLFAHTLEIENTLELKHVFHWSKEPRLDIPELDVFQYPEDVNHRRRRDAEALGTVMANVASSSAIEIGTADGRGTLLMSINAPAATIHTVNIPPEDIQLGNGGTFTTYAPAKEEIGAFYHRYGVRNVRQILADTASWQPDIACAEVVFIDGCHDASYVINDTRKLLPLVPSGGFILWHDFHPQLWNMYPWIRDVCYGLAELYETQHLQAPIYHLRNSWIGIYRKP